jgi:hypothetical protein
MHLSVRFCSRISVVPMTGAAIIIDDAAADNTIRSVKERVFAANRELYVHRQRLVYRSGPRGSEALANHKTLGSVGVAQDWSARIRIYALELDLQVAGPLTKDEVAELGSEVLELTFTVINDCRVLQKKVVWT